MSEHRPEVIVAATLYLMSGCVLEPSPCGCRVHAIVVHLERLMQMEGLDPVIRATAIQLHENWQRVATQIAAVDTAQVATERTGIERSALQRSVKLTTSVALNGRRGDPGDRRPGSLQYLHRHTSAQ